MPHRAGGTGTRLRWRFGVHDEHTDFGRRVIVCGHRRREPSLANAAIQARRAAAAEDGRKQIEGCRVRMRCARRAPAERDLRLRDIATQVAIAKSRDSLLRLTRMARWFARRERSVRSKHLAQRDIRIYVADD